MITAEQAHKLGIQFSYAEYLQNKQQYQEDGERLLIEQPHSFLYYEPGKGKTYPAIFALNDVAPNGNILILSTADAINNMWDIEIVPQKILPKTTLTLSFTSAIQEKTSQQLMSMKWDVIIVDESHKIKSHNSKISKLVYRLTKNVKYAWGLSGTPRGNADLDIFCQFHNMNVGEWGEVSYTTFTDNCCDVEKKWGPYGTYKNITGISQKYLSGWERNLSTYTQRVTYTDGDMPPLKIEPVKLKYEKTEEYTRAEDGIMIIGEDASTMTKLVAINKMHQAANGYLYHTDIQDDSKNTYRFQHNIKLDWLKTNITDIPTTIVYRHRADLEDLQQTFPMATEDINDFKHGKSKILLLQCSRCESFNLQMCNRMIFYTMDYSFIKFKQMLHRIWRMGQEQNTLIQILLFDFTVELNIWAAVNGKQKAAELFMAIKGER